MDEDWDVSVSFLPDGWRAPASETGALKDLRKDSSVENLLRALLLHVGCGHFVAGDRGPGQEGESGRLLRMALMKRLKKSKDWLQALCVEAFREPGVAGSGDGGLQVRAFDATTVEEPGRTGSLWRLHASVRLRALACDFFEPTAAKGRGAGESLAHLPIRG